MEQNIFNLNNKIYSNNNNILLGIIKDLQQIINLSKDNIVIKRLGDIIIKMNYIINENKKNTELIRNDISKLYNQMNKQFNELKINTMNDQEIIYNNSDRIKYIGKVLNGVPNGKGTMTWKNGDRYEGDWKNDEKDGKGIYYSADGYKYVGEFREGQREGKGIAYWNNGDRYEGDFKNSKAEGKGIYYYNSGNRYEGDMRNDLKDGKGIIYYANGDRQMGDYSNDNPIGKHVTLTKYGNVEEVNY